MNDPVVQALVAQRVALLFEEPFIGNLATRLELVAAPAQTRILTTDGLRLYYQPALVRAASRDALRATMIEVVLNDAIQQLEGPSSDEANPWARLAVFKAADHLGLENVPKRIKVLLAGQAKT
ncbi:hypothetical protein [Erythrobacter sp. R86502]|uniref:hypothetical protein n=1 Tax=Erythrobacter sp. R86502 TaxID=3093846 RepID=UPI0036D3270D